jgi:uncharacterized protein (TIGR03663 family)
MQNDKTSVLEQDSRTIEESNGATVTTSSISRLDRPLLPVYRLNWELWAWSILLIVAAVARFYDLGARALSHDESLHALYSYYLYDAGNYEHNPMMHGPLLFHMNAVIYFLFGHSDTTARILPAVFGLGVIIMAWHYRRYLGRIGALAAGIMLAFSPSLLFHSRYIRDDIYIGFFTMVWVYGAFRYLEGEERRHRWLVVMLAGMAFGFVTMENHFIHGALIGAFFASLALWQVIGGRLFIALTPLLLAAGLAFYLHLLDLEMEAVAVAGAGAALSVIFLARWLGAQGWVLLRRNDAADLAILMLTLVMPFTAPFLHLALGWEPMEYRNLEDFLRSALLVLIVTLLGIGLAYYWFGFRTRGKVGEQGNQLGWGAWAQLMGAFWLVQVLFFTTFLTNTRNGLATGIVGSLGYWLAQQEVARGGQPWYYYIMLMWLYEFLPAFLSAAGAVTIVYFATRVQKWQPVTDLPADVQAKELGDPAIGESLRQNRVYFGIFAIWWCFGSWLAYTIAGEKMPWLLLHTALPMCVLGGWWLGRLVQGVDWRSSIVARNVGLMAMGPALLFLLFTLLSQSPAFDRGTAAVATTMQWFVALFLFAALGYVTYRWINRSDWRQAARLVTLGFVALLALLTIRFSYMLTYVNYDMATEYLVYAHGTPDIKRMLAEIDLISQRTVGERNIVVAYDDDTSWPLSWYMRLYPNSRYYGNMPNSDVMSSPVIIVGPKNYESVRPYVARDYVRRTYLLVWWPDQGYFNLTWERFWNTIRDPERMRRIAQIVFYRRHMDDVDPTRVRDLTKWPNRHEFEMYVRRDLAAQIWDLNVIPLVDRESSMEAVLREREVELTAVQEYKDVYNQLPLFRPRAVTVDLAGNRYVADTGNHRIVVFNRAGDLLRTIGSECRLAEREAGGCIDPDGAGPLELGDGQFYEPWGVAAAVDGTLFVADTWNGRIQVFDPNGTFVRKWGYFNSTGGELGDPNALFGPRGLAIDAFGNLLIADTGNKRILQFTPDGQLVHQIGGGGVILGRFEEPVGVAVDYRDGSIYIADTWNRRIQKLDPLLTPVGEWMMPGWSSREIYHKPYLAVASNGDVYATDPQNYRVVVFSSEGEIKAAFGDYGSELYSFALPTGIGVDLDGSSIVIADADNDRVLVVPAIP